MDLFYQTVPVKSKKKIHFHDFMQLVLLKLHNQPNHDKKIQVVADQLIEESWLLCLDEFQITDVATGVIIAQLFTELFNRGAVIVTTSNRLPNDLYTAGFKSVLYQPFIYYLNSRMDIVHLRSKVDYREELLKGNFQ